MAFVVCNGNFPPILGETRLRGAVQRKDNGLRRRVWRHRASHNRRHPDRGVMLLGFAGLGGVGYRRVRVA